MKSAPLSQCSITAHDTLEQLSYTKRPAFNALWQPKDIIAINVKATERRRILGDEDLESIIKERPRRYMVPSISLDDVEDKEKRKLLIDFIYKTTMSQAAKEVWGDFKHSCLSEKYIEKQEEPSDRPVVFRLSTRFQGAAKKWDSMQSRSFLENDICYDKTLKKKAKESDIDKKISEKKSMISKLIDENKLSIIYDKLPSSYTGYRPYIAYGVPLEKKEI